MPAKLTTEVFISRSRSVHGDRFTYDNTVYVNSKTPVTITCKIHGDIDVDPNNHIHAASGCARCAGTVKKTTEQFIAEVERVHPGKFTFERTEYINDGTKVTITCKSHGDFTPVPSNILRGSECPKCALELSSLRNRRSREEFIDLAAKIHDHKYDYSLVEYKNSQTPVTIICKKHGAFQQRPTVHTDQRCGCPKCLSSRGENEINQWLKGRCVTFKTQHSFDDCKDKGKLRFDFYIPSSNLLIEYNGIQHYRNVPLLKYSNDTFEDVQRRDAIKVKYAKEKGLRLVVVPYNVKLIQFLEDHITPVLSSERSTP